ncbi:MAG: hypothetical protein ACRDIY_01240, partial [Chloroflexota bacterium]
QILNLQLTAAPPPIANARSDVPLTVQQVIEKGLEKDPSRRFQSAEDMIEGLDHGVPMVGEPTMIDLSPVPENATLVNPSPDLMTNGPASKVGASPGPVNLPHPEAAGPSPSSPVGTTNGSGALKSGTSGFTPVGIGHSPHAHPDSPNAIDAEAAAVGPAAPTGATGQGTPPKRPIVAGQGNGANGASASPIAVVGASPGRRLSGKTIGIGAGVIVLALIVVLLGPTMVQGFVEGWNENSATPTAPAAASAPAAAVVNATAPAAAATAPRAAVATIGSLPAVETAIAPAAVSTKNLDWKVLVGTRGAALGDVAGPMGLAFDTQGNLYVADRGNNRIEKFSPDGKAIAAWGSTGIGPGQFDAPADVAVDRAGNVFVLDSGNDRIQKLTPEGKSVGQWGAKGTGPGQFDAPKGIALGPAGDIYVADSNNNRIQKLSPAGQPLAQWGQPGNGRGDFRNPEGVAVKSNGTVVVADSGNNRLEWLSPQGTWVGGRSGTESENDLLTTPVSLTLGPRGNVFALEWQGDRVQEIFSPEKVLALWGQSGSAVGDFNHPHGIALDGKGHLYVADSGNDRIEVATLP